MKRLIAAVRASRLTDLVLFALIVTALLGALALLPGPDAITPEGDARVIDGDSLKVAGVEVRLMGVDAPEAPQRCTRSGESWPCGREASKRLARRIGRERVRCEGENRDQHGRLLARCQVGETELNRWLVEQGWAVSFGDYKGAEARARAAKRGIWAGEVERPADWRAERGL